MHPGLPPEALLARLTPHTTLHRTTPHHTTHCVIDPLGASGSYFHPLFSSSLSIRRPRGFELDFQKAITRGAWWKQAENGRLKGIQLWHEPPPSRDHMPIYCGRAGGSLTVLWVNSSPMWMDWVISCFETLAFKLVPVIQWLQAKLNNLLAVSQKVMLGSAVGYGALGFQSPHYRA